MNVQQSAFLYLKKIFEVSPGIKVLLLDQETLDFVSIALTKTELLELEVVLAENIKQRVNSREDSSTAALNCIILVRPTAENVETITKELDRPHFQKYNIFFTNKTAESQIRQIASHDSQLLVETVREAFLDFYALSGRLFSLNVPDITSLRNGNSFSDVSSRVPEGLFAFICSQRVKPHIRFDKSSSACQTVARAVASMVDESRDIFAAANESATVLILDRRSDPVCPLLHLWYYASALHDIFGIKNNIVATSDNQYVLNERTDVESQKYYSMYLGDLAPVLTQRVQRIQDVMRQIGENATDMSSFHGKIAAVSKGQTEKIYANAHLDLFNAMHKEITEANLMEISALEQIVATCDDMDEQCNQIIDIIGNPATRAIDALRLALIFVLHYEKPNCSAQISRIMEQLEAKAVWQHGEMKFIEGIVKTMGDDMRGPEDLFSNHSFMKKFSKGLHNLVSEEKSMYEMYKCILGQILDRFRQGKLSDQDYPYATRQQPTKTSKTIVFYVGGATYEEMRIANEMSQPGFDIVVGGTTVHNADSFIKYEVAPYC